MIYLDTSILLPLFVPEPKSNTVPKWFAALPQNELAVSEWTCTEFMSAVGIKVRIGQLDKHDAEDIVRMFRQLVDGSLSVLTPTTEYFKLATRYLERFDLGLRAGDALHLAIASSRGAHMLYSLDQGMIKSAHALRINAQVP